MHLSRARLLVVLLSSGALTGPAVVAQTEQPAAPEPETAEKFAPAAGLDDALDRALKAIREAEKGGSQAQAKFDEARFYTDEAARFDPANPKAEFLSARLNRLIGRGADAFSQVQTYVKTAEGSVDWEAFEFYGRLFYESTYYVQAEAKYRRAAELSPGEASVHIGLARVYLKRVKRREAVEAAQQAVQLDPTSAEAQEVLAQALLQVERFEEAKAAVLAAIERTRLKAGQDPGSLTQLSRMKVQHEILQGILAGLIRRDRAVGSNYLEYAASVLEYADLGRLEQLHRLQATLEVGVEATQPNTPAELIEKYAEVSAATMRHEQAIEVLEKLLETNPLDEAAQKSLDMLKGRMEVRP